VLWRWCHYHDPLPLSSPTLGMCSREWARFHHHVLIQHNTTQHNTTQHNTTRGLLATRPSRIISCVNTRTAFGFDSVHARQVSGGAFPYDLSRVWFLGQRPDLQIFVCPLKVVCPSCRGSVSSRPAENRKNNVTRKYRHTRRRGTALTASSGPSVPEHGLTSFWCVLAGSTFWTADVSHPEF